MESIGYVLIDAYNMAYKAVHIHEGRKLSSGGDSSVIYGVMQQIATVRTIFPGHIPIVVWDSGYDERTKLSEEGVRAGVVPERYKQNRDETDPFKQSVHDQVPFLKSLISCTDIPQVIRKGCEADDLIASYCELLKGDGRCVVCYTSDDDYLQLLTKGVVRSSKNSGERIMDTEESFFKEYGISPSKWVDVGALCGDSGDNIFGVPGCGCVTAVKLVKEFGTYEKVLEKCQSKYVGLRAEYPDLDEAGVDTLRSTKSDKRNPYLHCKSWMPFTGVALAIEQHRVKNPGKQVELCIAMYEKRVRLAYLLKKMVKDIPLPVPKLFKRWNKAQFEAVCAGFELREIIPISDLFACSEIDRD